MNERVKLIRKQLGMTQEQLAQRLGIGKAALSMIETGIGRCGMRSEKPPDGHGGCPEGENFVVRGVDIRALKR